MGATVLGNQWAAWMFDRFHSYVPAWQACTGLMVATLGAAAWLRRAQATRPTEAMPTQPSRQGT